MSLNLASIRQKQNVNKNGAVYAQSSFDILSSFVLFSESGKLCESNSMWYAFGSLPLFYTELKP